MAKVKKIKILFAGGGTGGHIMPIIAVAREIKKIYQGNNLFLHYIGQKDKLNFDILGKENIKLHSIFSGKIRNYFSFMNYADVAFNIPLGFIQSFFLLLFIRPKLVFSKGGTGSLPVTYCAKVLRIPVFIHESDAVAGRSNQIASTWAKKVFISFPKTEQLPQNVIFIGNPIRKEILEGDRETTKTIFSLTFEKPVILFLGGSQGAQAINDVILLMLNDLLQKYEVIHVTGPKNYKQVADDSKAILSKDLEKYYHLFRSLDEIELKSAYYAADLIVGRAGSGSIFEIAALGKPSLLIPLPSSAGNHQAKNAYQYAATGAAVVIEQENLTPHFFLAQLQLMLLKKEIMKQGALEFSKPMAAEYIAKEILNYLDSRK